MNFSNNRMLATPAFISAFPPLSTDLYLPALPQMVEVFGTSPAKVNLTLSLFFIFFAGGILIWGPLSEKYGRKPILYCGLVIYTVSSLLCSAARSCDQLILFRIFQAFGGGAATAVATAIVKDLYTGAERARVLAVGRLFVVLKNPGFSMLLCVFSAAPMPLMAFIAGLSYVYIQGFGLSEQVFSLFFAANAVCAMQIGVGSLGFLCWSLIKNNRRIVQTKDHEAHP